MASNEEIIDYVMESPDNTNPNVLRSMLGSSGGSYVLPVASADTLGGVKVGSGLSIADGVLSASGDGGGVLLVNLETDMTSMTMTMDKTWKELKDADLPVLVRVFEEPKYLKVYTFVLQVTEGDWEGSYLVDADLGGRSRPI